jgi:hypothetical protein
MMRLTLSLRAAVWSARIQQLRSRIRRASQTQTLVSRQMAVHEAQRRVVEVKADDDAALVACKQVQQKPC